jgi:hypothetical protein
MTLKEEIKVLVTVCHLCDLGFAQPQEDDGEELRNLKLKYAEIMRKYIYDNQ